MTSLHLSNELISRVLILTAVVQYGIEILSLSLAAHSTCHATSFRLSLPLSLYLDLSLSLAQKEKAPVAIDLAIVSPQRQGALQAGAGRVAGASAAEYENHKRTYQDTNAQCE